MILLPLDRFCVGVGGASGFKYRRECKCQPYPQEVEGEVSQEAEPLGAAAGKGDHNKVAC